MEILAEHTDWSLHYGIIGFLAAIAILALLAFISMILSWRNYEVPTSVLLSLFTLFMIYMPLFCIKEIYNEGVTVYYDAIVTDWDVVYDAGYTVVEQNGEIVKLTKE